MSAMPVWRFHCQQGVFGVFGGGGGVEVKELFDGTIFEGESKLRFGVFLAFCTPYCEKCMLLTLLFLKKVRFLDVGSGLMKTLQHWCGSEVRHFRI